jgi:3-deoxy-7-phosphoheptulonate synthase
VERKVIACIGDERGKPQLLTLNVLPGVDKVMPVLAPYKFAARTSFTEPAVIEVTPEWSIGGDNFTVIAGPCAVENEEQILSVARSVKAAGANALRGGAFKPRSSTYSFQGLGEEGLKLLKAARDETGLPVVTELLDPYSLDLVAEYADVIQIGARNMQNFSLLKAVGKTRKPVILKRGLMATVEEFLMSAEYILAEGNPKVILCERGIRTFEKVTRNTLDLNAVPALQDRTYLPVIVDPSHGTGVARYVAPMCRASVASGAAGIIVEVHPNPTEALSDGEQSLEPEAFAEMMGELERIAGAMNKSLGAKAVAARQ